MLVGVRAVEGKAFLTRFNASHFAHAPDERSGQRSSSCAWRLLRQLLRDERVQFDTATIRGGGRNLWKTSCTSKFSVFQYRFDSKTRRQHFVQLLITTKRSLRFKTTLYVRVFRVWPESRTSTYSYGKM